MKKLTLPFIFFLSSGVIANNNISSELLEKNLSEQRRQDNLNRIQELVSKKSRQISSTSEIISDCESGNSSQTKINYPTPAVKNREFGRIQLEITLNKSGCVTTARILQSSNFENLDNAALTGVLRMKFTIQPDVNEKNIFKFSYNFKIDEEEMNCITNYKQKNSEILNNLAFLVAHTRSVEYCKSTQKNSQTVAETFSINSKSTLEIIESIVGKELEPPKNTTSNTNDFSNPLNITPPLNYAQRIARRIQPNITLSGELPNGIPSCEVEIKVKPDGEIFSRKIIKSSGYQTWDSAVIRAIDRTARIPLDVDGKVPPILIISFKP